MLLIVRFGRTLSVQCVSRVDVNPPVFRLVIPNAVSGIAFVQFLYAWMPLLPARHGSRSEMTKHNWLMSFLAFCLRIIPFSINFADEVSGAMAVCHRKIWCTGVWHMTQDTQSVLTCTRNAISYKSSSVSPLSDSTWRRPSAGSCRPWMMRGST